MVTHPYSAAGINIAIPAAEALPIYPPEKGSYILPPLIKLMENPTEAAIKGTCPRAPKILRTNHETPITYATRGPLRKTIWGPYYQSRNLARITLCAVQNANAKVWNTGNTTTHL